MISPALRCDQWPVSVWTWTWSRTAPLWCDTRWPLGNTFILFCIIGADCAAEISNINTALVTVMCVAVWAPGGWTGVCGGGCQWRVHMRCMRVTTPCYTASGHVISNLVSRRSEHGWRWWEREGEVESREHDMVSWLHAHVLNTIIQTSAATF